MDPIDQIKSEVEQTAAKFRAEANELSAELNQKLQPPRDWKLYAVLAVFAALVVLGPWLTPKQAPPAGAALTPTAPAVAAPKVAGPVLYKPLLVVPKQAVRKKFGDSAATAPGAEVLDTAEIPASDNGVETVTYLNLSTATATTVYRAKPAPWFALENRNAVGAAYLATTAGPAAAVYAKRDLFRIKDFHVSGVAGVAEVNGKPAAGAGIVGELRF